MARLVCKAAVCTVDCQLQTSDLTSCIFADQEQRELYEAAKIIQTAYRQYKGRKRQQAEQDRERQAAVLIQNYYRRYKQVRERERGRRQELWITVKHVTLTCEQNTHGSQSETILQ